MRKGNRGQDRETEMALQTGKRGPYMGGLRVWVA